MTEYFIDASYKNINKFGEELCGDNVETVKTDDGVILVLSDGLGSGVKANILATLTSKIAVTMLKEGASIEETIDTITNTLPECSVRKLAYSTFTIIKIKNNGDTYMVEYDNPPCFFFRKGCDYPLNKIERVVNGKKIYESHFKMTTEDLLVVTSDGAVHAGVGELLNLGWQWEDINEFLRSLSGKNYFSGEVSENLLAVCNKLYNNKPGDDTTVLSVKLQYRKYLDLFTGPPANPEDDEILLEKIRNAKGLKILSGGTTSNIVSKAFGEEVFINLKDYQKYDVPPVGFMRGVDLVTEGLITLNKTVDLVKQFHDATYSGENYPLNEEDGATLISRMLLKESTHINIWAGTAVNPAHQNPDLPTEFNIKLKVVRDLKFWLEKLGKTVNLIYL